MLNLNNLDLLAMITFTLWLSTGLLSKHGGCCPLQADLQQQQHIWHGNTESMYNCKVDVLLVSMGQVKMHFKKHANLSYLNEWRKHCYSLVLHCLSK